MRTVHLLHAGHYVAKIGDWGSARAVALSGNAALMRFNSFLTLYTISPILIIERGKEHDPRRRHGLLVGARGNPRHESFVI